MDMTKKDSRVGQRAVFSDVHKYYGFILTDRIWTLEIEMLREISIMYQNIIHFFTTIKPYMIGAIERIRTSNWAGY